MMKGGFSRKLHSDEEVNRYRRVYMRAWRESHDWNMYNKKHSDKYRLKKKQEASQTQHVCALHDNCLAANGTVTMREEEEEEKKE